MHELSKIPAAERQAMRERLQQHYGSIAEIARRCEPPKNRATITLWLQGRVQSASLDEQLPKLIRAYLNERE